MYRIARTSSYLIPLLVLYVSPIFAAQEPKEVASAEALKARVVSYYTNLKKGQKAAALDLVAPESKNEFFNLNNEGLVDFRVLDVQPSDAGESATVRIQRTDNFAGFPQVLKRETVDTWKRIDGQWYVVLPVHKENGVLDTPFGKMDFSRRSQNDEQATPPVPLPAPQSMVSPEEATRALQKVFEEANRQKVSNQQATTPTPVPQHVLSPKEAKKARQKAKKEAITQKQSEQEKKPEDKKSEDQAAPKPNPPN